MIPGQQIGFTGFNVIQIAGGPWCVVFNPSSLTVGAGITVSLDPNLFLGRALPSAGTIIDAGMLVMRVVAGAAPPTCQIVIDGSAWKFDTGGYRPGLVQAFASFTEAAEQLEGSRLRPGATEILSRLLAARVPATYEESLYLAHGVMSQDNPARTHFDLQPGMRLVFDFEERQFVPPATDTGLFSGFVGGATATTDVVGLSTRSGAPRIGVHAFLSAVRLPQIAAARGGFAGIIDLAAVPPAPLRHVRLCYPRVFPGADAGGFAGVTGNIAVLGTNDLVSLRVATDAYYAGGQPGAALIGFFRGRTVVHPQLPVLLNGRQRQFVPAGTTLRQLLERLVPVPRLPGVVDGGASTALGYRRRQGGLTVSAIYGGDCYQQLTVDSGGGPDPATNADGLDFPVLAADVFNEPLSDSHG